MDQPLCKLTLVYPTSANDRIIELMLRFDPPLAGFTTWTAEGHGFGFSSASISERVRGRVRRAVLIAVLPRSEVDGLLSKMGVEAPIAHITFWIEPVEAFGHLATATAYRAAPSGPAKATAQVENNS